MSQRLLLVPVLLLLAGPAPAAVPAAASPDPKSLVVPPEELSKARELVQQLGSEQFHEREQAERDLAKMGRAARAALLEGVNNDPSPEIRSRCHSLLPRATSLEMKARLDVFLADTEGKHDHDLPGWHEFRRVVRDEWKLFGYPLWADTTLDKSARKVFADLLSTTANRYVVMAAGGEEEELGQLVAARRQELYNQKYGREIIGGRIVSRPTTRREPTVEDIAALLFAEVHAPSKATPRTVSISVLLTSSGFVAACQKPDEPGKVYRSIVAAWLDTRQDPIDMYNALNVSSNLGLPEHSCRLAVRLLDAKGAQVYYRGNAAATLARLGNKSHIPLLEKSVEDATILTTLRKNVVKDGKAELVTTEIQIRDVALAVSIILAGQKPDDFGFTDQFKNNGNPANSYSYTRYTLEDDQRKAALEKWKAWREKNP
jgi:hypothetical protein